MKYTTSLVLGFASLAAAAAVQECSTSSGSGTNENNNWFCGAVNHILYQNFALRGSFQAVSYMGPSGECRFEEKPFKGPLAPLDEDLSIHFRGPLELKEVAVYNLESTVKRHHDPEVEAGAASEAIGRPHGHRHKLLHRAQRAKRADMVVATINGKVVSWENRWFGEAAQTAKPTPIPAPTATPTETPVSTIAKPFVPAPSHAVKVESTNPASGSNWQRIAYYNAQSQHVENIVFMGNYGGQGSGVWDSAFGNSLSFLNVTGDGGSSKPEILSDLLIPSNKEFAIFSGEKCDESCGFSRVPEIAYKGFAGGNKIFLFHFRMPHEGTHLEPNGDMPAIWALNGRIPRTAQYNACSCWKSGCGEADIFEVLAKSDTKCKSTMHLGQGTSGGSSDYFQRPISKYIRAAAIFHEISNSVSIKVLPDHTDFSKRLDDATVMSWIAQPKSAAALKASSLFQLSG